MKAIQTSYGGHLFRSRLEARWAAFFQAIGWIWEYEPVDFNGWIPDFGIYGSSVLYVEIKPVTEFPEDVAKKITNSGCSHETLILGETIPLPHSTDCIFGWLNEIQTDQSYNWWQRAVLGRWMKGKGQIGFCGCDGVFRDRISGGYDGGCWGAGIQLTVKEIKKIWASAGNETRWLKRGGI